METDYRQLCKELFGTDDPEKLREISEKINSSRNAGRKKKFSGDEISEIMNLISNGMTLNSIAEKYGTSRQVISRYLNKQPENNYTMRMTYMFRQHPCTVIDVDFLNRKIKIQNKTDDIIHRAFGVVEEPDWDDFEYFLEDRCFPRTRANCMDILKSLGLDNYDPLQIIEKTKGKCTDDKMWIKIKYYNRRVKN